MAINIETLENRVLIAMGEFQNSTHYKTVYNCAITHDCMFDPVVCADSFTYQRENIERWLKDHNTSPSTGGDLTHKLLNPNQALKELIFEALEQYKKGNPSWIEAVESATKPLLPEDFSSYTEMEQREFRLLCYLVDVEKVLDKPIQSRYRSLKYKNKIELDSTLELALGLVLSLETDSTSQPTSAPSTSAPPTSASPTSVPLTSVPPTAPSRLFFSNATSLSQPLSQLGRNNSGGLRHTVPLQKNAMTLLSERINSTFSMSDSNVALDTMQHGTMTVVLSEKNKGYAPLIGFMDYLSAKGYITYNFNKAKTEIYIDIQEEWKLKQLLAKLTQTLTKSWSNTWSAVEHTSLSYVWRLLEYRYERQQQGENLIGIPKQHKLEAVDIVLDYIIQGAPLNLQDYHIAALKDGRLKEIVETIIKHDFILGGKLKNAPKSSSIFSLGLLRKEEQKSPLLTPPDPIPPVKVVIMGSNINGKDYLKSVLQRNIAARNEVIPYRIESHNPIQFSAVKMIQANAIIICYDVSDRDSFESIHQWIRDAKYLCSEFDSARIFIIAVNSTEANRVVSTEEAKARINSFQGEYTYMEIENRDCSALIDELASLSIMPKNSHNNFGKK